MRPSGKVNAIAGEIAWSFSDEELQGWLARGLLLDGPAAHILIERGFGGFIGLHNSRFITQSDLPYAIEHCLDENFSRRAGAQISVNVGDYAARLLQGEPAPGARLISELRGPTWQVLGHGAFLFQNELGGRVAVVPWDANRSVIINIMRAAQLSKVVAFLDPTHSYAAASGHPWLVTQLLQDDERWRGVVWNAGPDEVESFSLRLPTGMEVGRGIQVVANGTRRAVEFEGTALRLDHPLQQWEFIVLA
jgi:hypothetical protein